MSGEFSVVGRGGRLSVFEEGRRRGCSEKELFEWGFRMLGIVGKFD